MIQLKTSRIRNIIFKNSLKLVNFLMKTFKIWAKFECPKQQVVFIWFRDETSKVGKNSAKGRFAVNWSHEFVIAPSYFDVKKRNRVFIFSLRSEFDVFVLTILPKSSGSFIRKSYKYNLLFTLLHRTFKLCSNSKHVL